MPDDKSVLVVGGGISGLVAARSLAPDHRVTLVEAADRFGGKVQTEHFRGRPLDAGPDAFLTRNPVAVALCQELGLSDALIAPSEARAALFVDGRLRALPTGLVLGVPSDLNALRGAGVVSKRGQLRARADLFLPFRSLSKDALSRAQHGDDPSVAKVVGRRLGKEVLNVLVDPLLGGINASDVAHLSLAAAAPQILERTAGQRSLVRALARTTIANSGPRTPMFFGLSDGLSSLVDRVVADSARRGVALRTGARVEALEVSFGARPFWRARVNGYWHEAAALVLALPAYESAALLSGVNPSLAEACAAIPYASVATVTMAWRADTLDANVGALTGVLVPRRRDRHVTAATFTSTKWPRSANPGEVVVRASVGRHGADEAVEWNDTDLYELVTHELRPILSIREDPLEATIARWPRSFPQYTVGHLARQERIDSHVGLAAPLRLCGAAYRGIGVPACIEGAQLAASQIRAALL